VNNTGAEQTGCGCAREYAERWPDMTPAELEHVHAPTCPVRLRRKYAEGERAHRGGGLLWAALLRE